MSETLGDTSKRKSIFAELEIISLLKLLNYLKSDKNKEFQRENRERSPENLIFRRDGPPVKQKKVDINTVPKEELELMEFFFEDIPQV